MAGDRFPISDPRTLAHDIPGLLEILFPQLTPGVVANFNRRAFSVKHCVAVASDDVDSSALQHAMLFEVAVAAAEQILNDAQDRVDWGQALAVAVERQRRHFDARLPTGLEEIDKRIALQVAKNLVGMLGEVDFGHSGVLLERSPPIPGYQWISSGVGDFAVGSVLVEVKCTNKNFSSADYRQILMYWLLSFSASIERRGKEFSEIVLLNPRLNRFLRLSFDECIGIAAAGRSKVELLEVFSAMVGERRSQFAT